MPKRKSINASSEPKSKKARHEITETQIVAIFETYNGVEFKVRSKDGRNFEWIGSTEKKSLYDFDEILSIILSSIALEKCTVNGKSSTKFEVLPYTSSVSNNKPCIASFAGISLMSFHMAMIQEHREVFCAIDAARIIKCGKIRQFEVETNLWKLKSSEKNLGALTITPSFLSEKNLDEEKMWAQYTYPVLCLYCSASEDDYCDKDKNLLDKLNSSLRQLFPRIRLPILRSFDEIDNHGKLFKYKFF